MNELTNFKVVKGCHIWTGSKTRDGYGKTSRVVNGKRKFFSTHRLSFLINFGDIPEKLYVLHKCDTPLCINPEHLFLGTHQDNMTDMVKKGRGKNHNTNKTHCKNNHELKDDNLYIYKLKDGKTMRQCKECKKIKKVNNKHSATSI